MLGRQKELCSLGSERLTAQKRAQGLKVPAVARCGHDLRVQPTRIAAESPRHIIERLVHFRAQAPQLIDGHDRQRQIPGVDRPLNREKEPVDRGPAAPHLAENSRRYDNRARRPWIPIERGRAPTKRGLRLVRKKQAQGMIDRQIARA